MVDIKDGFGSSILMPLPLASAKAPKTTRVMPEPPKKTKVRKRARSLDANVSKVAASIVGLMAAPKPRGNNIVSSFIMLRSY